MARERGMTVDVAEFNRLMEEQKSRGKAAQKKEVITVEGIRTGERGFRYPSRPPNSSATKNLKLPCRRRRCQ